MGIYYAIFAAVFTFICIGGILGGDKKIIFFFSVTTCILFIFISTIRWERGTDWTSYYEIYQATSVEGICNSFYCLGVEPGFYLINWMFSSTVEYNYFLFLIAISIIPIKFIFFNKHSNYPLMAILLYFCFLLGDIFPVRQSLACSLALLYFMTYRKHKICSWLFLLAALSIHYSSLLFFITLWFFSKEKLPGRKVSLMLILGGGVLFLVIQYPPAILASRINDYIIDKKVYSEAITPMRNILKCTDQLTLLLISYLLMKKSLVDSRICRLAICGSVLSIVATILSPQLARLSLFFIPFQIVCISSIFLLYCKKSRSIIFPLVIFYGFIKLNLIIYPFYDLFIPFNSQIFK